MIVVALSVAISAGQTFNCTPVAVWDGDGPIWCAEGPKIRLAGIAAREIDGICKSGHPCPSASGLAARCSIRSAPESASMRSAVVTSTLDEVSRMERGVRSPVMMISSGCFAGFASDA